MPAENAGRAFALVLVDELARRGVQHAVIAPGSRSTPVALAMVEHPKITVHVRIDERSAAYLALGIAKATGDVVPVLCTSGTATSYFHGAAMEADLARVPLLLLTADRPAELHGIGANQTVEQSGMFGGAVRWAYDVPAPEASPDAVDAWRETVRRAVEGCLGLAGHPPGAVHLNLALREPLVTVDDGIGFAFDLGLDRDRTLLVSKPALRPDDLAAALHEVHNAVVVVGDNAGDPAPVIRWCEQVGWPLIAEPHSNARRGSAALRAADAVLRDEEFVAAQQPDLVVVVGRIGLSRPMQDWLSETPHIVLSPDGGNWNPTRRARTVLRCETTAFETLDASEHQANVDWTSAWRERAGRAAASIDAVLDAEARLTEPQVARDVARAIPGGGALVVASSMPIRDLDVVMEPRDDITVFANRGVSGIDGFVSTALGIALARPNRPTVALCGDLSLLHDSNGFLAGSGPPPDVTFVVINNDGGGIFSLLPQGTSVQPTAFEQLFGTPHGVRIDALASAYSIEHRQVTTSAELSAALASHGGIRIVEMRSDRADNAALHTRLREAAAAS